MLQGKKNIFITFVFLCSLAGIYAYADPSGNPEELRAELIDDGKKYVGAPYQFGATGPDAFDCSGFIFTVARESTGYQLPRTVKALYSYVKVIPESGLEKGDIVFFRTTGNGSISHAGIYMGNGQFMHAVSDGPNTGVIISSLKEAYWKSAYAGSGQFLPPGRVPTEDAAATDEPSVTDTTVPGRNKGTTVRKMSVSDGTSPGTAAFVRNLVLDASVGVDWSFFTSNRFLLNFRGVPLTVNVRNVAWPLQPGIGTIVRFNAGTGTVQIPILFSMTVNDYLRVYTGPVMTFGAPELPGSSESINASVFPGIIGVSWQTPSFTDGPVKLTLTQDIVYTVFNDTENGALSVKNSFAAGLVFSTGIRVTLPVSSFLH
jgi:hypothetical protein